MTLRGIFPDYMHIVHLALAMDSISSVLLDLSDPDAAIIAGGTRDARLNHLWESYRDWCEGSSHLIKKTSSMFLRDNNCLDTPAKTGIYQI